MSKYNLRKFKRSGSANCEICKVQARLEEHHIKGRKIDKYTHPSNIVWLCPLCHSKQHDNDISINGWVMTTDGLELQWESRKCS